MIFSLKCFTENCSSAMLAVSSIHPVVQLQCGAGIGKMQNMFQNLNKSWIQAVKSQIRIFVANRSSTADLVRCRLSRFEAQEKPSNKIMTLMRVSLPLHAK